MQQNIEKQKLESLEHQINEIQRSLDNFPKQKEVFEAKKQSEIQDPEVLHHWKQVHSFTLTWITQN